MPLSFMQASARWKRGTYEFLSGKTGGYMMMVGGLKSRGDV